MSQQDNFSGGFLLGAIVGGVVGGVLGALLTSQRLEETSEEALLRKADAPEVKAKGKKRPLGSTEQNIELARRSLEDKIAQLNDAIDDVRQQLSSVNGQAIEGDREGSLTEEP
jgi:gas vesicle protein